MAELLIITPDGLNVFFTLLSFLISVSHSTCVGTSQTCFVLLCPQLVEDCYGALSSSGLLYSTGIDISEAEVYIKMFGGAWERGAA